MELQNRQQEGRWQNGSSGHTNQSPNRPPEMHGKRWATNGFLIRNNYNINNYCFIRFLLDKMLRFIKI